MNKPTTKVALGALWDFGFSSSWLLFSELLCTVLLYTGMLARMVAVPYLRNPIT